VIDHEIFSTVIHTVPLLFYVQELNAVAELCSGKFNVTKLLQ
jgi:hypothetical protein